MRSTVPAAVAPPLPDRILSANFVKLFIGAHLYVNQMSLYYLLPHFLELRGASPRMYGLAAGTAGLSTVLSLLLLGRFSDRWSRKVTVLTYLAAGVGGDIIAVSAVHAPIGWYFVARALHGVSQGLGFPLVFGWAVELCPPRQRYVALSWMGIAGIVSNSLGPFLAELILELSGNPRDPEGFRGVFALGLAFTLLAGAIFATVDDRRTVRSAPREGRSPLRRRDALLVLGMTLLFGGVFGSLMSFGKNYTESLGLEYVSLLMVAYSIGAIASRVFIREIAARFSHLQLTTLGLLGLAVSVGMLSIADGYVLQGASGLLYGASHGVLYPTLYVRFIDFGGAGQIGRSATTFQGAFSVGMGALPVLGGFLISGAGFPAYFWLLAALAAAAVWLNRASDPAVARRDAGGRESG